MTGIVLGLAVLGGAAFGWPLVTVAGLAALALVLASSDRGRPVGPALAAVVAAALGAWRTVPPPVVVAPGWVDAATAVRGRVASAPAATGRVQQFALEVESVTGNGDWVGADGRLCVTADAHPVIGLGDEVRLTGRPKPYMDEPGGARAFLRSRGCGATMFAERAEVEGVGTGWRRAVADARRALSRTLQEAAPGDAGALLSGLVTGDDHALTSPRELAFRQTGTSHITAVSGANLALILVAATTLGRATGWRRRLPWQFATVAAVWGYAVLVGLGAPALRAALVATAAVLANRIGRRPDYVTLIVLAAALMVAVEPAQLWRLGFQLSLASSLALAAVLTGLTPDGLGGWLQAALAAAVAAQVATLPVLIPAFGMLSPLGLPANLLIAPLVGVAFPLAAVAAILGLVWFPLGEAVGLPAQMCANGVLAVVDALGGTDLSVTTVGKSSQGSSLLVAFGAVVVIVALSRDGRNWAHRTMSAVRRFPSQP